MADQLQLTFITCEKIAHDIYLVLFHPSKDFTFTAGQYIQITLPHDDVDEKGSSRFFTISSAPHEPYLMITTTRSQSSFKRKLFSLQKGDIVEGFGPIGKFTLDA